MQRRIETGLLAVWITIFVALSLWTAGLMTSMVGQATPGFFVQPLLYVSPFQPPTPLIAATTPRPISKLLTTPPLCPNVPHNQTT